MSKDRKDREHQKFVEKDGETAVRIEDGHSIRLLELEHILEGQNNRIDKLITLIADQQETMGSKGMISDGRGTRQRVKVTSRGQLVAAPLEFSEIKSVVLDTINIPFSLVTPRSGKQFVITDLVLYADKNVGPADASLQIYAAQSLNGVVGVNPLISMELLKNQSIPLTGLNIITPEGVWINAVTNDNNVFINIAGYYIDIE